MKKNLSLVITIFLFLISGCTNKSDSELLTVVTTTTMISDLVKNIGGEQVTVLPLMVEGVDPHLYQARESDVQKIFEADLIVFNGFFLEAKLDDIFSKLENTVKLEDGIPFDLIIIDDNGASDPHIWFDLDLWKLAATKVAEGLTNADPKNEIYFQTNLDLYHQKLDDLANYIEKKSSELAPEKKVLITAHDGFSYFARANNFIVKSVQGLSTESEASTSRISQLANYIATHEVKAIFIESSIPIKTVESLKSAVKAKGFLVEIGGELYSDSLKENYDFIETYKLNIDLIVESLK